MQMPSIRAIGFRVGGDGQVQRIFLVEESIHFGAVAGQLPLTQGADVAAGTEGPVAGALDHHGVDVRIFAPGFQDRVAGADHRQIERIERLGAVEQDAPYPAVAAGDDGVFCGHAVVSLLRSGRFNLGVLVVPRAWGGVASRRSLDRPPAAAA
jgi:hypothetical protein